MGEMRCEIERHKKAASNDDDILVKYGKLHFSFRSVFIFFFFVFENLLLT
jgi:hypothetical protein